MIIKYAEVAQLAERHLAKVEAGVQIPSSALHGDVAEWLRRGLQNLVHRFDSGRRLQ